MLAADAGWNMRAFMLRELRWFDASLPVKRFKDRVGSRGVADKPQNTLAVDSMALWRIIVAAIIELGVSKQVGHSPQ